MEIKYPFQNIPKIFLTEPAVPTVCVCGEEGRNGKKRHTEPSLYQPRYVTVDLNCAAWSEELAFQCEKYFSKGCEDSSEESWTQRHSVAEGGVRGAGLSI